MNSEKSPAQGATRHARKTAPAETHPSQTSHPHLIREFSMRFTSSRHGARLARRLVSHRLDTWGHPYDGRANETLTLITAELTANAIRHGHVPGRDFRVRLTETGDTLRVEVSDTRSERVPPLTAQEPPDDVESGRGLLIVAQLATRWTVTPRVGGPGKTVCAELRLQ
ncbi:ATP-binding protein [Streptomyces sp. NEAU-Y11]|uniref:ATP-binding protein n=1 Tax=Streptomyces cucumeris TaxID=2962890 RepID=UPI0026750652|nr:ATP-binding protein [Streptomyces sp. NEAU-Y11]